MGALEWSWRDGEARKVLELEERVSEVIKRQKMRLAVPKKNLKRAATCETIQIEKLCR